MREFPFREQPVIGILAIPPPACLVEMASEPSDLRSGPKPLAISVVR